MLALIIPVSKADIHLLPHFVQVCQHLGHFGKHRVIFVPTLEVAQDPAVSLAAEHMKDVSDNVTVTPLKFTPQGGWPKACNQHFNATVPIGSNTGCNWYFCELDTTPLVVDWLNILETELNLSGKNYLGAVVPTRYKQGINGNHMVGAGIYAHDMARTASLWKFCHAQSIGFDIYQRDELRPRWTASKHMQHMWGTVNFRKVQDVIMCSPKEGNPEGTDHSGEVLPNMVVVHGCKDGSLAQLVLSKPPVRLEGAVADMKPAQKVHFSGNPEVWRLVKDSQEAPEVKPQQSIAPSPQFSEEVSPETHFERLCEALGIFPDKNQDVYQMLLDRIPTPQDETEKEQVENELDTGKPAETAQESQETHPPTPQGANVEAVTIVNKIPEEIVTPAKTDLLSKGDFPSKEQLLAFKSGDKIRFSDTMNHFGISLDKSIKFKNHLNDMGIMVAKGGWLTTPEPGRPSFATA